MKLSKFTLFILSLIFTSFTGCPAGTYEDEYAIFSVYVYSDTEQSTPLDGIKVILFSGTNKITEGITNTDGNVCLSQTVHDPNSDIDYDIYFAQYHIEVIDPSGVYENQTVLPQNTDSEKIYKNYVILQRLDS